jgi:hypothetical protein
VFTVSLPQERVWISHIIDGERMTGGRVEIAHRRVNKEFRHALEIYSYRRICALAWVSGDASFSGAVGKRDRYKGGK